ncbi:alpha/beta fold hydrolase [Sutcliffiella cohnii]
MNNNTKTCAGVEVKAGFIENGNYQTYYEIHTPIENFKDNTPIVLLAGGPGLSFKTLTPLFSLAETRPVIGYDQLGSGRSTRSERFSSLTIKDFVEQFKTLVTQLNITEFHLLGHSWGTILGVNIALQYPKKTKSLILHSGIANWKVCLEEREKFAKEHFPDELKQVIKKMNEGLKPSPEEMEHFTYEYNKLFYCRVKYPNYLIKSIEDKDVGTNQLIWNPEKNKEIASYNICRKLNEIHCPALIISGKYDGVSVGQAKLFKSGIKKSRHIEFQNSSHYSHIEEEDQFNEYISNFLIEVDNLV